MVDDGAARWRRAFVCAWCALLACKLVLAARVPLFVDEAFYWQEGRHLALAYSDLPGLTAWMARLGDVLAPGSVLALRLPFLLVGAALPWLVVALARRSGDEARAWQAGGLAMLLPLAGTSGILALPDVPLLLATLLCLHAVVQLLDSARATALPRVTGRLAAAELALGLVLGALCHYRFAAVIACGALALLSMHDGRRLLSRPVVLLALIAGALAWWPLLQWNLAHGDAGVRFQLVDRHPWQFSPGGLSLGVLQLLPATPLLLWAMLVGVRRQWATSAAAPRFLARGGGLLLAFFLLLGFFADRERVSFHWTVPGMVALLPIVPAVVAGWRRGWRLALWALAAAGLAVALAALALVSSPGLRAATSGHRLYPVNFAGWDVLADAVRSERARLPTGTRLMAGDFKIGAELGFALGDADIPVLDHPINHKHGRSPQLALWNLLPSEPVRGPVLLVVSPTQWDFADQLAGYHGLCARFGPLPAPRVLNIDHGRRRFLLFAIEPAAVGGTCTTPAMATVDSPGPGQVVPPDFEVAGWAFKDGVGLGAVEILVDGTPVARARYGMAEPRIAAFWAISTDPHQPNVYFRADVRGVPPGVHWLGLRLHGRDGSVEDWSEQRLVVRQ